MAEHTPTPWECDWGTIPPDGPGTYCDVYIDGGETIIARVNDCIKAGHANAAFIVNAVNNHEALVKALMDIRKICAGPQSHGLAIAECFDLATRAVRAAVG